MARTLMARLPQLFRTCSWVHWKKSHSCRYGIKKIFFFIKIVYRWGDLYEITQYPFVLKNIEKISLFCFLSWCNDEHSLAWTTPVSNIFLGLQRCLSRWNSTVLWKEFLQVCHMKNFTTRKLFNRLTIRVNRKQRLCIFRLHSHCKNVNCAIVIIYDINVKKFCPACDVLGYTDTVR